MEPQDVLVAGGTVWLGAEEVAFGFNDAGIAPAVVIDMTIGIGEDCALLMVGGGIMEDAGGLLHLDEIKYCTETVLVEFRNNKQPGGIESGDIAHGHEFSVANGVIRAGKSHFFALSDSGIYGVTAYFWEDARPGLGSQAAICRAFVGAGGWNIPGESGVFGIDEQSCIVSNQEVSELGTSIHPGRRIRDFGINHPAVEREAIGVVGGVELPA